MSKLRVGILGCANIAIRLVAPAFQNHLDFKLVGFAGRDIYKTTATSKLFNCEAIFSYQEMIDRDDIDLVYIPLPNALHFEWVMKALKSGNMFCVRNL
jgi:predicted dehydrogenase